MAAPEADPLRRIREDLLICVSVWGLPDLAGRVSLRTSTRFKTTLGRFQPDRFEITLAAWLVDAPRTLRQEVVGHEAAHAAVHLRYGSGRRPHGTEWQAFMHAARLPARVRIPTGALPAEQRQALAHPTLWEHRCPVCHAMRSARTRVTRWRCARCRAAGHSGELVVKRRIAAPL